MATSLAVSKAKNYQILISTAQAQVSTPINLQVENDLLVYEGATLLGKHMEGAVVSGKPSSGITPLVIIQGSTAIAYGRDTSVSQPWPVVFITSYYLVDSSYVGIGLGELRRRNLISGNNMVYFSAADCVGDMGVMATASQRVHIKYVAAPDCTVGPPCGTRVYKVNAVGTYPGTFNYASYARTDTMQGYPRCDNNGGSLSDSYVVPAAGYTTVTLGSGGEPPATVSAIEVRPQ